MRLVIETDELVKLAKAAASEKAQHTFKRIEQLVMRSPSLADVVGRSAVEDEKVPVKEQALDFLTERNETWFTTAEVREACELASAGQVLTVLKQLRDEGRVVCRSASGRSWQWKVA